MMKNKLTKILTVFAVLTFFLLSVNMVSATWCVNWSDDFNDGSIDTDLWTSSGASEASGYVTVSAGAGNNLASKQTFVGTSPYKIEAEIYSDAGSNFAYWGIMDDAEIQTGTYNYWLYSSQPDTTTAIYRSDLGNSGWTDTNGVVSGGAWANYTFIGNASHYNKTGTYGASTTQYVQYGATGTTAEPFQVACDGANCNQMKITNITVSYWSDGACSVPDTTAISIAKQTPADNKIIDYNSQLFYSIMNISGSNDNNYTWDNYTLRIWDSEGDIFFNTTVSLSDTYENKTYTVTNFSQTTRYDWDIYGCYGNVTYSNCTYSSEGNFSFFTYITINILDYLGQHLDSANIECASAGVDLDVTSPYRTALSTFTSQESEVLNCTISDLLLYNRQNSTQINFSTETQEYNVTLNQKELILNFYHYNGSSASVTGYFSDGNYTQNYTNTTFMQALQGMLQGRVRVMFGYNESIMNYTQYYEYENDWITHTNENMTVLGSVDTSAYIKVIDEGGNPIDDVLVRVAFSLPEQGGTYKEMGQRFTGSDGNTGMTSFFFDSFSDVSIRFTKDGYSAKTIVTDIGANTYTYSDPLTIVLQRDETNVYKGIAVRTYTWYNTNMSTIPLSIYAPSRTLAKYTTSYRSSLGLGNATITLDEFKKGKVNLTRGVDFCTGCLTDLTITIYIDNEMWGTLTVPYQESVTDKFEEPSDVDSETKARVAWIFVILFSGVLAILIKGSDESLGSGSKGKAIFFICALILGVLFPTDFTFLLVIVVLYGIMLYLRRFIGE